MTTRTTRPAVRRRIRQSCLAYILAIRRRRWWLCPIELTPQAILTRITAPQA